MLAGDQSIRVPSFPQRPNTPNARFLGRLRRGHVRLYVFLETAPVRTFRTHSHSGLADCLFALDGICGTPRVPEPHRGRLPARAVRYPS